LPVVRCTDWRADLQRITDAGYRLLALTPSAAATSIRDILRRPHDRIAIVLGAEGPGLTAATLARAEPVRIPQRDDVDSLNVGHAAAVAFALLAGTE
ncbi:MAG: TrmH family RNA methyltransferase, partial [Ilumatobacteraceae bacterium]